MLRFCLSVFAFTVLGAFASAEDKKDVPKELLPFQGKWEVREFKGEHVPPKEKWPTFAFEGEKVVVMMPGSDRKESAAISADPDKKPGEFDLRPGDEKNKVVKGIFKFEKDTLTLCFPLEAQAVDRPKEFKADKPYALIVLVKEKK